MRSKMLGLAIALTTFGLGVSITTFWIAYTTPEDVDLVPPLAEVTVRDEQHPRPYCRTPDWRDGRAGSFLIARLGLVNDRAVERLRPVYPNEARVARVAGPVSVEVEVDGCGQVVWARALDGHPLLQSAAVEAATRWRFTPFLREGRPEDFIGVVTFRFLLQ